MNGGREGATGEGTVVGMRNGRVNGGKEGGTGSEQ